ncbi:hypothetical protein H1R20_g14599, partial [Candolleomyces eurysporus]
MLNTPFPPTMDPKEKECAFWIGRRPTKLPTLPGPPPPLPPELLMEIFFYLALDTANQRRNIRSVSLVCTQWAKIAYSTKELWTAIHYTFHKAQPTPESSSAFRFTSSVDFVIGMARGLPLEINWKSDHNLECWWPPFNIALERVAKKVSNLTLDLPRMGMIHALQHERAGQERPSISSWPRLEKLKLRSSVPKNAMMDSFDATTGDMPRLVDLSLINISVIDLAPYSNTPAQMIEPMFPWRQLVRLQLSKPDLIEDIALVLVQCRALEECSFYAFSLLTNAFLKVVQFKDFVEFSDLTRLMKPIVKLAQSASLGKDDELLKVL